MPDETETAPPAMHTAGEAHILATRPASDPRVHADHEELADAIAAGVQAQADASGIDGISVNRGAERPRVHRLGERIDPTNPLLTDADVLAPPGVIPAAMGASTPISGPPTGTEQSDHVA